MHLTSIALTCQGKLSSSRLLKQFSIDLKGLCCRLAGYFIVLNWLPIKCLGFFFLPLSPSFFPFQSVSLQVSFLRISSQWTNILNDATVVFWSMHLLLPQLSASPFIADYQKLWGWSSRKNIDIFLNLIHLISFKHEIILKILLKSYKAQEENILTWYVTCLTWISLNLNRAR